MSTSIRPAEWVSLLREEAQAKGRPILGLSTPSVLPVKAGGAVVYARKRGSKFVLTSMLGSGQSQPLTGDLAMRTLKGPDLTSATPGAIVFPDAQTAWEARAFLEREGTESGKSAARAIDMCMALASSGHVVILTSALERKFYASSKTQTQVIEEWRAAFGLSGLSALEADKALYRMVVTGPGGLPEDYQYLVSSEQTTPMLRKAQREEASILESLQYTGLASECSRFAASTLISGVWSFIASTDPLRRELSQLDGTVFSGRIIGEDDKAVYARIRPPFKAKIDKEVLVLSATEAGDDKRDARLALVDVSASPSGDFVAHLSKPGRWKGSVKVGDEVDLVQAPFLARVMRTARTRWTSRPEADGASQRTFRDVPLSVSLAGAPQDGR